MKVAVISDIHANRHAFEATLDRLAEHLERHIDCDRLLALARAPDFRPAS